MEGRLKAVTSLCVETTRKRVLIGTEGGNIYLLRLWNMTMEHEVIFQDKVRFFVNVRVLLALNDLLYSDLRFKARLYPKWHAP